ncbi:MAG: acyl-CoA dehydrogenase family protein [Alphaproteobacteria bacterium]|nr:acyl-CoA dehydrogenase family protein [Alphaproteobacteria bacterium]
MGDVRDELVRTAGRLFAAEVNPAVLREAEAGQWPGSLWDAVAAAGLTAALVPEDAGGSGLAAAEAMSLLRVAAAHAAPIPLAETMLAGWLLARAGLQVPEGRPLAIAPVRRRDRLRIDAVSGGWRLTGTAARIPWARNAAALAVVADGPDGVLVARLPAGGFGVTAAANLAGEPRDAIEVDALLGADAAAPAPPGFGDDGLHAAGAVVRTNQIAGALERALALTVEYARTRIQFGQPIGKFQAIQHNLAVFAGQAAAAVAAAEMAAEAFDAGLDAVVVGAAKARAGEAANIAAAFAHQSHGAIGFTQEFGLHPLTRRLWSWRDEFGNEAEWQRRVGEAAFAAGADGLWPMITLAS